jgi:hypothetical protein
MLFVAAAVVEPAPLAVLRGRADGFVPSVQVSIRGKKLWFDLDTGALFSVVDTGTAETLGLKTLSNTNVRGAGKGSVPASILEPVPIRLGSVLFQAKHPRGIDLSNAGSAGPIAGILGYDFFTTYVVSIDFATYEIKLYDPLTYRYGDTGAAIPLVLKPPRAYVNAVVSAQGVAPEQHLLRVDSGSSDAVDDDIVLRSSAPKKAIEGGNGIGHRFASYLGTVDTVKIGPYTLHDLPSATGSVQLIGDAVWHRFNVVFDFSRSVMYLTPR